MSEKQSFGRRINDWLQEDPGETFRDGKWRFWFIALVAFSILNAILTALVFSTGGQNYMWAAIVSIGAVMAWLGVGALPYSDNHDRQLAQGVSILDSITLLFCAAHFCFLLWVYGHVSTLQSAETTYKADVEKYNGEARQVQADNAKIADALKSVSENERQRARIENDTAYQLRKAAQSGARIQTNGHQASAAASLSTSPVELAKPPAAPKDSSVDYLTRWDSLIRLANFGELGLAVLTLIFIRNRSAATNSRSGPIVRHVTVEQQDDFPHELEGADIIQDDRSGRRLAQTRKSDRLRQSYISEREAFDRKKARKKLLEHLKVISHYLPGRWFKADLIEGGVHIRMCARVNFTEQTIADTRQSDKLLAAVERPDFQERLLDELIRRGFPIEKDKVSL